MFFVGQLDGFDVFFKHLGKTKVYHGFPGAFPHEFGSFAEDMLNTIRVFWETRTTTSLMGKEGGTAK